MCIVLRTSLRKILILYVYKYSFMVWSLLFLGGNQAQMRYISLVYKFLAPSSEAQEVVAFSSPYALVFIEHR